MTDMEVGRAQWDLLQDVRHLRDVIRRDPEAIGEIDGGMLDETVSEFMGIVGELSIGAEKRRRAA